MCYYDDFMAFVRMPIPNFNNYHVWKGSDFCPFFAHL
jgi:hypothetical protein